MTTSVKFNDRQTLLTKGVSINKEQKAIRGTLDMTNETSDWIQTFRTLFDQKVTSYKKGMRSADAMFSNEEKDFLRSIGATPQEIYDFVEDWCDAGEPDPDMVVSITQIRRDYFLNDLRGQ